MGGLFSKKEHDGGGKKKPEVSSHDKAILELKIQRDKLKQYQKKVDKVIVLEKERARDALKAGKKKQALLLLKKKKYQETLLEKTEGQLLNLEEMVQSIEFSLVEQKVLEGLKSGNAVLEEIHKEMSVEEVERIMDETADNIAYQNEIDELLAGKLTSEDDAAILAELDELAALGAEEATLEMPAVPTDKLPERGEADGDSQVAPAAKAPAGKKRQKELVAAQ